MRYLMILMATLFIMTGCGQTTNEQSNLSEARISETSTPNLIALFELMTESASNGASLEAFWYSNRFWYEGDVSACEMLNETELSKVFRDYVSSIFTGGGEVQIPTNLKAKAFKEFDAAIGKGNFHLCTGSRTPVYSFVSHNYIIKKGGGFRLKLSFAVED